MFSLIAWIGYLVALVTGLAMLKDTFLDRGARRRIWDTAQAAWAQARTGTWPDMEALRPALRFGARAVILTLVVASAGVCLLMPDPSSWYARLLCAALAAHMATQVPCPWFRWVTVGDVRAKTNDPPGVERRVH